MPAPKYQNVLIQQLPEGEGWQIIGIKSNNHRQLIAVVAAVTGEWFARRLADMAAQNLAEKYTAEIV